MQYSRAPRATVSGFTDSSLALGFTVLLAFTGLLAGPAASALTPEQENLSGRVAALAEDYRVSTIPVADRWFLIRFYERRQFTPAWAEAAKRDVLFATLASSARHGLDPDDYHLQRLMELDALLRTEPTPKLAADIDLLATDALARLAFHLRFGKVNPEQLEPSWNFTREIGGASPVSAVNRLVEAEDLMGLLDQLAPREQHYLELMEALSVYRRIEAEGGWPHLPAGPTLREGMRDPRVAVLRRRLAVTGDLAGHQPPEDGQLLDEALAEAVRHFQRRHGLDADAAVGPRTREALNVPVSARIDQLRINLERARWIFRDLEPRYIITNIARFKVSLVEDGEVVWSTRSVVGRPYRQTPVFKARMSYLVFNPTWTVPPGILRRDLLPEIRQDPGTLARRNMTLIDMQGRPVDPSTIDWAAAARSFPYMIRQEPGPENALGRVKFMFPNPHHVYMHDTPARELFGHTDRTFSSGCIRLESPLELARILLEPTGQWDEAAIQRTLATGRSRTVQLPEPLAVLMIYGTAVPDNGVLMFLPDVYDRDQRLLAALDADFRFTPPAGFDEAMLGHLDIAP
ncbi:MAG: L,D-transpeptidase family protein [Chromatiales bacterium]|nr:L,D-transpeptidase family protein [Chromatiales bacterium]